MIYTFSNILKFIVNKNTMGVVYKIENISQLFSLFLLGFFLDDNNKNENFNDV